jgi:predicted DNA-binding protein
MQFEQFIEGMGSFDHFDQQDRALKFWLPEPAREALEDLAKRQGQSMSELLRQFLFQHCYGVYAYVLMMDKRAERGTGDPGLKFSRAYRPKKDPTYWVPELGKNVTSLKIWMSNQMHADLEQLAQHSHITLSQYVREIVISRLLGHGTLPKRPEMLEAVPLPWAENWEAGQDVQMRQVSYEEYRRHDDGRVDG